MPRPLSPPRSLTARITALATAATAVVLLVVLAGVLAVFSRQLSVSVDDGLRVRLADLRASVVSGRQEAVAGEALAQLYAASGEVVTSSGTVSPGTTLLARPACDGVGFATRTLQVAGRREGTPVRVLSGCLPDGRVLAVGVSLEPQAEARERLLVLLALASPVLLALVALTVGRAVHAALRPVDLLTQQAAQISAGADVVRRLPAGSGNDEIARLTRTLDEMLGRLGVAFAREQAFVDDAAHELRTPLAVLRGELELALSDLGDQAGVAQSLGNALGEAERLSRLAEDLLVLARQRTGRPVAPPVGRIGVRELLEVTGRRLGRATPLMLQVDCPDGWQLPGTASSYERMLANLLSNAAAAGATTVLLRARPDGRVLLLSVEDDGPGFDPGFLPSAFERFSRADVARTRSSGAGLGLALVQALVQDVGGSVTADNSSALGGAAVRLRLPLG